MSEPESALSEEEMQALARKAEEDAAAADRLWEALGEVE